MTVTSDDGEECHWTVVKPANTTITFDQFCYVGVEAAVGVGANYDYIEFDC